ncbi:divalent-cation tolerance protein CutA [Novosphingobium album (ex Liu et al. 2023)]|uniref:Divalent-cation tolerance protein CutA n=1 Tax=Novosphingobium album (ex Liu et al. 2023) TaxID=3031130 RepID=A0ABT5WNW3_9SPHN|nr:divalent-cation tolerance protein CutA [Novosphingobium album (ex Liu et al. 2023)]MDE8651740.1 divalent-cation tolerance protein CutA [Novosphingobium album (ex Liu et al. 2023)]
MTEAAPRDVPALLWCPFPDGESAAACVHALLDEGLIACGNILPAMTAIFVWNGTRSTAEETGALLKTNAALLEPATRRLAQLHPYDEPAVLGWRCDAAASGTAAWLAGIGG